MSCYETKSMKEALELANKFKKEGTFDLFRGQANANWEVIPSLYRTHKDLREQYEKELNNFYYFCVHNDLLNVYTGNDPNIVDEFIAIAQHYGLKTNFIDFTDNPEIAMYFATHDDINCKVGEESVIVCLNRKEFKNEVNNGFIHSSLSKRNIPIPRILELDLTNLWRLKAQKGCFMEVLFTNLDKVYGFDRIYFPYSEPFDGIQKNDIYPERKSPIEIELDKFFMDKQMSENNKIIKNLFPVILNYEYPPEKEYNKIFRDYSMLSKHSSWETIEDRWNNKTEVQWKYQKDREQIQIDIQKLMSNDNTYYNQLVNAISKYRNILINIEIINTENIDTKIQEQIKIMYDGMNVLPYSNEHIANAIKELLRIELDFNNKMELPTSEGHYQHLLKKYGDMTDKIEVEFGESEEGKGYYSRSFIFKNDYQSLLRNDILEHINSEYLSKNTDSVDIKSYISKSIINLGCDIRLIFDFNKLVDLFAIRVIPFQILLKRNPILFNPAKIRKFS